MSYLRWIHHQAVLLPFLYDGSNHIDVDIEFIGDLLIFHYMTVNYHSVDFWSKSSFAFTIMKTFAGSSQKFSVYSKGIVSFFLCTMCIGWLVRICKLIIQIEFNSKVQIVFFIQNYDQLFRVWNSQSINLPIYIYTYFFFREREREGKKDRQTDRLTERERERNKYLR